MTVAELILILQHQPQDARVLNQGYEYGLDDITPVCIQVETVAIGYNGTPTFGGRHERVHDGFLAHDHPTERCVVIWRSTE